MADTNWVNTPETALTMSDAAPTNGTISTGTLAKGTPASDYGIDITYTSGTGDPSGPMKVYVAKAGTIEVDPTALGLNMVLIGSHTPVTATPIAQISNRFGISQAFAGQIPDSIDVAVVNNTGFTVTALTVTPIRGHYATA